MPDINQIINQQQQDTQDQTQALEQLLLQLIFNPLETKRQRVRIDATRTNVIYELREGTIINPETGSQEKIEELVINPNFLSDGTPLNLDSQRCQTCGQFEVPPV